MKRQMITLLLILVATTVNAQQILKGDMNNDEQVTIADVTSLVNVILGKTPQETISTNCDPYAVDNSLVVGSWNAPDGTSFAFNEDGTTTFPQGTTYKFRPIQGVLTIYDATESPIKAIVLNEVMADYLVAVDYSTNTFTKYTKQSSQPETVINVTIAEFNAATESVDVWYQVSGMVKNLYDGDQYGNFDLEDGTGSVYVYGLRSEKGGVQKQFQQLADEKGIKNGCKITIIGNRASYKDKIEVLNAYFVSIDEAAPAELIIRGEANFEESTIVSIIPSDVSHDVYYTLDGSDPKTSSTQILYTEPFTITESCTVRAWEEDADIYAEKTFTKAEAPAEMTVEEVIAAAPENTNAADGQQKVWVKGYIVGFVEGANFAEGAKFTAEGCETVTNLLLAANPAETNVENCIPVQLLSGDVRAALNLQDNPDNLGKEVKLYGYVLIYFKVAGLKNVTDYIFTDTSGQHSYVDLGLPSGTLWATCNIGASSPEEYGDYFAWGETVGYNDGKTTFDWSTYKWCKGSNTTLTKYCSNSSCGYEGFSDDLTELELADDAAYVNWGLAWRMPSIEQLDELINSSSTTTEWTTQNGVNGLKITSNTNGNSIFLPAAGFCHHGSLIDTGSDGGYWSRTLRLDYSYSARRLRFYLNDAVSTGYYRRYDGQSVRPVRSSE